MQVTVDATVRDPARFLAQMHEMHLRNAKAWASAAVGLDLANQIEPDFRFGPEVRDWSHHPVRNKSFDHSLNDFNP